MIIALTGKAGSGKSTVAEYLCDKYGYTIVSLADPIKRALYTLNPWIHDPQFLSVQPLQGIVDGMGWDDAKRAYPEIRRLLQVFGTEIGREQWGESFWVDRAEHKLDDEHEEWWVKMNIVVPDVRFDNEAYWATDDLGGKLWRIVRPDVETTRSHASENGVSDNYVSSEINNNGSLTDLYEYVDFLVERWKL